MRKNIIVTGALALATAVTAVAGGTQATADTTTATAPGVDVRVATFNVQSVSLDRWRGAQRPWRKRRGAVIREILGEQVDVIGVQEAHPSRYFASRLVDGRNQYLDLRNGLNKAGGHYRLTNAYPYNCVRARTNYKCRHKYRGATYSDRILYDADTISLVRQGGMRYRHQAAKKYQRYLAWAILRVNATGTTFLFTTTHLEVTNRSTRQAQWYELIQKVNSLKGTLPVVVTGDFNTQKYDTMAATMLPAMKSAGYGDVLNQVYAKNPVPDPRTTDRVNGWVNSANHERRDVSTFGYETEPWKVGNSIDWIFASNDLPVRQYKVVLNFDPQTWQVRGVLPSDHNMVRATLTLPLP